MPTFNADQWRQAREAWVLVLDGREYVAREVSAPQVVATQLELQGAAAPGRERAILLGLFRKAFPKTVRMLWAPQLDPVRHIAELPPPAFSMVVQSFFAHVTGNPVTSMTVMGRSQPTSSSRPSPEAAAEG